MWKAMRLPALMLALACYLSGAPVVQADPHSPGGLTMLHNQIEGRGIHHPGLLRAMRDTPRERFVPDSEREHAYDDSALAIGHGQSISQPFIVASMTQLLDPKPGDRILEIGTGSGYQAAILSQLVRQVFTVEILEPLAKSARALLTELGYRNITVRCSNGWLGWPELAPFDRIILTAAPKEIPSALIEQLRPGGRLVAPIGEAWQELVVLDKDSLGKLHRRTEYRVVFVPMVGRPN